MNAANLTKQIWNEIAPELLATLTNEQRVILKAAAEHLAVYHLQVLIDVAEDADHDAANAIMANLEHAVSVLAKNALRTALQRALTKAASVTVALI